MSLDIYLYEASVCDHEQSSGRELYSANITHNLGKMAKEAGLYEVLWRPDEHGYKQAKDILDILEEGLKKLKENPEHYRQFNAENGWGLYEHFVPFVENYYRACDENLDAFISVSR